MQIITSFPLVKIFIILLSAFSMPLIHDRRHIKIISIIFLSFSLTLSLITLNYVFRNGAFYFNAGYPDTFLGIQLYIGPVETLLSSVLEFVILVVVWFSAFSIDEEIRQNRIKFFYILIHLLTASILGIIYTNDIFNGYVFIEVAALASCGIIVIKEKKENIKAATKYIIMSTIGSGLLLMGIAFIYSYTGHLNMDLIHLEILEGYDDYFKSLLIIVALYTAGLGVKSAMFPLHIWLPDAHSSAPTASSALLSGVVLKGFAYFLIKFMDRMLGFEIINQLNILPIILILGSSGMIFGSLSAIFQKNIKRLIAYSSVAQMGYIFLAIGLGSPFGAVIAVYHMMGHAVTKSALFLCSGLMIEKTGKNEISNYRGLGFEMPITFILFTLGALSMVGIPILPGFISKWYLSIESIQLGKFLLIFVILLSSLLNAVYYFPIIINGFFGIENLENRVYKSKRAPYEKLAPIIVLITAMLLLGIFSKDVLDFLITGINAL